MSAFVFCLHRQGKPISKELFAPMMSAINAYGIDGKKQVIKNNYAIGYQRFWTTPEEVSEEQPLYDKEINAWLLFDGRIDNREEIYKLLNIDLKLNELSDAKLLMALYKQTGKKNLRKIIGPFVFVFFEEQSGNLFAGRDAMGGRYLVYRITDEWILFSTFEAAIAAHDDCGYILDKRCIANHFAIQRPNQPITYLKGITQLKPGYEIAINRKEVKTEEAYLPDATKRIQFKNDNEYVDAFNELLTVSIQSRLRTNSEVASMTSGGMDSLPMSVIAAELLAKKNQQLHTVSWVFDDYSESDERQYIQPVAEQYNFDSNYVNCDHAWPLKGDWISNPSIPFSTPYRTFHNQAYQQFAEMGVHVALSGMGGDMLYVGYEMQIYELIKQGRLTEALAEYGRRNSMSSSSLACFKMHFIWPTSAYRYLRGKNGNKIPEHITEQAREYVQHQQHWLFEKAQQALRPNQYLKLLDTFEGEDAAIERFYCTKYGFEMRYPFRDRRLVEFMLQIPSEQLNFNNTARLVMRKAMQHKLPADVLSRKDKTVFRKVFNRGMQEQKEVINQLLYDGNAEWSNYVKPDYINSNSNEYNLRLMLEWMSAYFQYWKQNNYL